MLFSNQPRVSFPQKRQTYDNEVTSHVRRAVQEVLIGTPQVSEVVCLQNQHDDPVDASDHRVQSEPGMHPVVLPPYRVAMVVMLAVLRLLNGVVHSHDYDQ